MADSRYTLVWNPSVDTSIAMEKRGLRSLVRNSGAVRRSLLPVMRTKLTPSAVDLDKIRVLDTCTVSNAIERLNIRLRNEGFVLPVPYDADFRT